MAKTKREGTAILAECSICFQWKAAEQFYFKKPGLLDYRCKPCKSRVNADRKRTGTPRPESFGRRWMVSTLDASPYFARAVKLHGLGPAASAANLDEQMLRKAIQGRCSWVSADALDRVMILLGCQGEMLEIEEIRMSEIRSRKANASNAQLSWGF